MPATSEYKDRRTARPRHYFATTHWSVVLGAKDADTRRASAALDKLCRTYWYPIYAYIRRRGHSPHDAEDLTQGFFARVLASGSLAHADPAKGKFRAFVLGALRHFLSAEYVRSHALKRGEGLAAVSLDSLLAEQAEQRFTLESLASAPADHLFDKEWAAALVESVMTRLETSYTQEHKTSLFQALQSTLTGPRESQPYAALAAQLRMTEPAVKTAVHRLRKRYRRLLEAEIASTVESESQVREELEYLLRIAAL